MATLVLPAAAAAPFPGPVIGRAEGARVTGRRPAAEVLIRFAAAGAVALSVAIPLVILLAYATSALGTTHWWGAVVATAIYLPLHVRHVVYGLRGVRPRFLPWTLLAMAVVIVGFTPLLGVIWLYAFHALAASILVTTRPRVSFPALACILVGAGIWSLRLSGATLWRQKFGVAVYFPVGVLDRSMMVFVLVWLVRALRRVQDARLALAAEALADERARIDDELRLTVGAQLEAVVQRGDRALRTIGIGSAAAEGELHSLVDGSRRALADARRLVSRYREVSSREELERAVALLCAAGIEASVDVRDGSLPATLDESLRASLRAAVAQLLREETPRPVLLSLGYEDGAYALDVLPLLEAAQSA